MSSDSLEKVVLDLESMGSVNFGKFTLKSGAKSPVYFDLRLMVSDPNMMTNASRLMQEVQGAVFLLVTPSGKSREKVR